MRYLIFSDLHSNLEALETFEGLIEEIDYDKLVCLGDTVGYAADPNPCVDWVRKKADIALAGNHDYAVVGMTSATYFNPYAYQACLWTRQILSKENTLFLQSLPVEKTEDGIYWVHSSPFEPHQWHYVVSRMDGDINFSHFEETLCFLGHSHLPLILEKRPDGEILDYISPLWDVEPEHRYIFNVGSLGQPRDGNPEPSFVVYDSSTQTIEFNRFQYDFRPTQEKILHNNLPAYLADRLSHGM